jgi:beta-glucosidase
MSDFKPKLKIVTMAIAVAITGLVVGCNNDSSQTTVKDNAYYKSLAEKLVSQMTLSEKLDVVSGPGMDFTTFANNTPINLISDASGVAGYINGVKNDKLDIPAAKLADGPAGLRINGTRDGDSGTYYATAWPIGSLLASSWDTDLVQQVGKATGEEVKEYGVDILLAPGMNIQRNPLNGRNFEYYSEDPLVTGKIGAAMVEGVESNGVGSTIKHFFGNNSETNRNYINDIGEPRTFREIYLRGFQIAVDEAQPWAVMTSYNKVNGTYVNQRKDAVTNILRDEWGFDGLVMSDWFAGNVMGDTSSATAQMNAGNDLIEPGGQKTNLQASVDAGTLTEAQVTQNAVHILTQVQKSPSYNRYSFSNNPDLNAHAVLARKAATEGMVLLKNNAALPIADGKTLATFGVNQVNTYKGGTGSGDVHAAYTVSIAKGLANRFTVNGDLQDYYTTYFATNKVEHAGSFGGASTYSCDEATVTDNSTLSTLLTTAVQNNDTAVITIGRQAGEGADRTNAAGDYLLSAQEIDMITGVADVFHAQGKKVVVVLNINGVIDTSAWADKADAILLAYMGGQDTGNEIADILSGDVNPSGKLAQTFPASYADVPSATSFAGVDNDADGTPDDVYYNEGIYVGYRYYTTFEKAVSYPFGFGLSYTTFGYTGAAVSENTLSKGAQGSVTLTATITNTGSVAGKEAAQVYVSAPEVKLKKPVIELKAFAKTSKLDAGATEKLTFNIPAKILASFDPSSNEWIVEPGTYKAYVSPSSNVTDVTPVTFTVDKEIVVSHTTAGALALPEGVDAATVTTITK